MSLLSRALEKRGPWIAALAAACAALPGLGFPFLSDDWLHLERAEGPLPVASASGYFRPLYMATFWLDLRLFGPAPGLFHLTNLLLIAAAAALVVTAVRRYAPYPGLAAAAGILFALHPYHVENVSWISARTDPLSAIFFLLAAVAYDRWRGERRAGAPIAALALFEGALLAKESAVILPAALIAIGILDRRRRPDRGEILQGYAPLALVALAHFALLRPWALGGEPRVLVQGGWRGWLRYPAGYAVASVVPVDVELLASRPALWGGLALAAIAALAVLALVRSRSMPRIALAAGAVFAVLIVPSVVGFQERYLFLASAASSVGLAALMRAAGRRAAALSGLVLVAGWIPCTIDQWRSWREAAVASERLIEDLVAASLKPGAGEIVVANMPFRVRGGGVYVYEEFRSPLRLRGGRPVPVRSTTYVEYPNAAADALDGPPSVSVRRPPPAAEVRLRIAEGPFNHYCGARPPPGSSTVRTGVGTMHFEEGGRIRIEIPPAPDRGRAAYVWMGGRLELLF